MRFDLRPRLDKQSVQACANLDKMMAEKFAEVRRTEIVNDGGARRGVVL